jgi:hypothetical protein
MVQTRNKFLASTFSFSFWICRCASYNKVKKRECQELKFGLNLNVYINWQIWNLKGSPYVYNLQLSLTCPVVCWYLNDSFFGNRWHHDNSTSLYKIIVKFKTFYQELIESIEWVEVKLTECNQTYPCGHLC